MRQIALSTIALAMASGLVVSAPGSAFQGDSLEEKLTEVQTRFESGSDAVKDFEIAEDEANVYLRKQSDGQLPAGIESPWIRFDDSLAVIGATLDLDLLEDSLPESTIFQLLSGRVPVELTAKLIGDGGVGKLSLERVLLSGVDLPPDLILSFIGDSNDGGNNVANGLLPPGFRLGEVFILPFALETIRLKPGAVWMRQRAIAPSK